MIIKADFFNIVCDRCGTLCNEEMWRTDKEGAREDMEENGFIEVNGKHYCQDCYDYDDYDNPIIKEEEK